MVTAVRFWKGFIDFSSAKYARLVAPFVFSESMELYRISLYFIKVGIIVGNIAWYRALLPRYGAFE